MKDCDGRLLLTSVWELLVLLAIDIGLSSSFDVGIEWFVARAALPVGMCIWIRVIHAC